MYKEEDYLLISGFQHYSLCRRRWALIYVENQWEDNWRTTAGQIMHKKAHDNTVAEKRNGTITVNALKIASKELGISGECDVVQFFQDEAGVYLSRYKDKFIPYPIEYKHGKGQSIEADSVQLCAQAMCLEEMLCCIITKGALFYGEPRRRTEIEFTENLRQNIRKNANDMHKLYDSKTTPKAILCKYCNQCSFHDICLPELSKSEKSVKEYLLRGLTN